MVIFQNNIKRFLMHKLNFVLLMVIPLIFIVLSFSGSWAQKAKVGIIDHDHTLLSQKLEQSIKTQADVVTVTDRNKQDQLINSKVDSVIVIPQNFTQFMLEGRPIKLQSYHVQASNVSSGIQTFVSGYLQDMKIMAVSTHGDKNMFYKALDHYQANHFTLHVTSTDTSGAQKEKTMNALGFVIFGLFMIVSVSSRFIMEDKKLKLYNRFFTTPLSIGSYNVQNILSYLTLATVTILTLMAILVFGFHAALGPSPISVFLVLFTFSVVSVSIGILISSLVKSTGQATALSQLIITPFAMLGGCFWPISITPVFMQKISDFVPTTWGMRALTKLVYGNTLNDVIIDLLILLAFAAVFFLLASWRRSEIAS